MTDKTKQPYIKKAKIDKIRHDKEIQSLEKFGYFINSKGENSKVLY